MASTMQLEFAQAMSDFKKMFPQMEGDVIEAVLRANMGAVDATIDQLLAMSIDNQVSMHATVDGADSKVFDAGSYLTSFRFQNETLRNELDKSPQKTPSKSAGDPDVKHGLPLHISPASLKSSGVVGASPKIKGAADNNGEGGSSAVGATGAKAKSKRWNPPMLRPLPPGFLRLTSADVRNKRNPFSSFVRIIPIFVFDFVLFFSAS